MQRGQLFHPGEHLHAALRLPRLRGLGAEAVDERFQVRALALLLLVLRGREDHRRGALVLEARIVARVAPQPAVVDVHDYVHDAIEEVAVVRDDEERAAVALQPLLDPQYRVEIEVIGGLVEEQQVGRAHERLREVQPHAPAAGEARHRLVHLLVGETQAVQELLGARARRIGVRVVERGMQLAQPHAGSFGMLGRFGRGDFGFQLTQPRVAVDRVLERRALERGRLLRDVGHAPARGVVHLALVGVQLSTQQCEEARLAGAVGADETDLLAGVQREIRAFEQHLGAAPQRDL